MVTVQTAKREKYVELVKGEGGGGEPEERKEHNTNKNSKNKEHSFCSGFARVTIRIVVCFSASFMPLLN